MQQSSTPVIPSPTSDVLRLAQYATATLSDARKSFGIMRPNIRPLAPGMRIAGVAHTVKCYP
ncbi:MAG: 4-carboxy-4-hydroxy-2-oxoadipate aldolase/oxaloacetate decarboxylase, partial [Chloroflexi bacterium]|nr:4-carboxy-4-hydroxy-2-oxoadipate aldolase/oxaloacetate decarboxylase [Chloroflexota bacterium]